MGVMHHQGQAIDSFVAFDPNKPRMQNLWAVYEHRTGNFKTYGKRPAALNATTRRRRTKLYRYDPAQGGWLLLAIHDEENKPDACDGCGVGLWEYPDVYQYKTGLYVTDTSQPKINTGRFAWSKINGKIPDPPVLVCVCDHCWLGM